MGTVASQGLTPIHKLAAGAGQRRVNLSLQGRAERCWYICWYNFFLPDIYDVNSISYHNNLIPSCGTTSSFAIVRRRLRTYYISMPYMIRAPSAYSSSIITVRSQPRFVRVSLRVYRPDPGGRTRNALHRHSGSQRQTSRPALQTRRRRLALPAG